MKRTVLIVIAAVIVLAIGALWWRGGAGAPVQAARAVRGVVRQYVDERGMTRLPTIHRITMPFDARINEIRVREGDRVQQGQVVAQVAESDLDNEFAEASAVVERLQASLRENDDVSVEQSLQQQAELFVQSMSATMKAAEARMVSGKKRLDFAETFLARTLRLFQAQAKTQEDVDVADLRHVESQVDYQQDNLVWQAIRSIEAATRLLPQMVGQYITRKQLTHAVLEKQKSEAEARLRQMKIRQQRGRMTSPVEGVILRRLKQNEQFLPAGADLLEIGDLRQLEIEVDVLSQDVVSIRPGDEVEVYGPAVARPLGQGLLGRVTQVHPAGFTKMSSLGVEQQRVKVVVGLPSEVVEQLLQQGELGVGYRVRARIFTDQHQDALQIPRSALFRGADGQWQVFVVRQNRAELQPVQTGILNDDVAEITEGVAADEIVILAPENSLRHGQRVQAILR